VNTPFAEALIRVKWHYDEGTRQNSLWEGGHVPEDAIEHNEEVEVGHRRYNRQYVGEGYEVMPAFIGQKVRFKGNSVGVYTLEDSIDESRLKRKVLSFTLYECPGGYRVKRTEFYLRRRKERYRWQKHEAFTSLLPTLEEGVAGPKEQTSSYGIYTKEEARRDFPDLFPAAGVPKVDELD
jgi:hypothetical protein